MLQRYRWPNGCMTSSKGTLAKLRVDRQDLRGNLPQVQLMAGSRQPRTQTSRSKQCGTSICKKRRGSLQPSVLPRLEQMMKQPSAAIMDTKRNVDRGFLYAVGGDELP